MPLDNNVGRISNKHTHKRSKHKPQANINFKQNKKKPEHILNINNTGTDLITLNIDLSENYIKVHRKMFNIISH